MKCCGQEMKDTTTTMKAQGLKVAGIPAKLCKKCKSKELEENVKANVWNLFAQRGIEIIFH